MTGSLKGPGPVVLRAKVLNSAPPSHSVQGRVFHANSKQGATGLWVTFFEMGLTGDLDSLPGLMTDDLLRESPESLLAECFATRVPSLT